MLGPAYGDGFVGLRNVTPERTVYISGDERTDGSIRLKPDAGGENMEVQQRLRGVWNDTGIQIAASTIHLGRDLQISGSGEFVRTYDVESQEHHLIPHVHVTDEGSDRPHCPVTGQKWIRLISQPDYSGEKQGTDLSMILAVGAQILGSRVYLRTGSIGATASVTVYVHRGPSHSDLVFWQRTLPASDLATPYTEFEIDMRGMLQVRAGDVVMFHMTSDEPFSIACEATDTYFYFGADYVRLESEEMLQENLIVAADAGLVLKNDGSFVMGKRFTDAE